MKFIRRNKKESDLRLIWFGHSCIRMQINDILLFFDPIKKNNMLATILDPKKQNSISAIFISHDHWDHCNPETILALCSPKTKINCPLSVIDQIYHQMTFEVNNLKDLKKEKKRIVPVKIQDIVKIDQIQVKCLTASEGLSFLILVKDKKLLFMGDSNATKEMKKENPDVILFPIWAVKGEEAKQEEFFELAENSLCIPMHYHQSPDALPNFYVDIGEIKRSLRDLKVKILEKNKVYNLEKDF